MENNHHILILAAGDIRNKFNFVKNNCSSPALIPVNTRPLAYYTLSSLALLSTDNKYLIIDEDVYDEVEKELHEVLNFNKIKLIGIKPTNSVIETLKVSLEKLPFKSEVTILLVTTIPLCLPSNNEIIIDQDISSNEEWAVISVQNNELTLHEKSKSDILEGYAFTGCFNTKTNYLSDALNCIEKKHDLIEVLKHLSVNTELKVKKSKWLDCGHEINYHSAKKNLINSRSFNKMEITEGGRLIKKSEHQQKLKDEVAYIKNLPDSISSFYPRIFSEYAIDETTYAYEMSYYSLPNVAELMLYWDLSENQWKAIFKRFQFTLNEFKKHSFFFTEKQHFDFYFSKLTNRVDQYLASLTQHEKDGLFSENLVLNNLELISYSKLLPFIEENVKRIYNTESHCIMHGDFCFNNILFDIPNDSIKLIDSRGSFSPDYTGIYGDRLYDMAKLLHSSMYGYDYLVNDLFKLSENKNHFSLIFNWRDNKNLLDELSKNLIINEGFSFQDVKFVVGLLFLSMTPLHNESKIKQKAMYLHGLSLVNEIYHEQ